jgi:hypothetical protein
MWTMQCNNTQSNKLKLIVYKANGPSLSVIVKIFFFNMATVNIEF